MTWRDANPAETVTAPVRAALDAIIFRGVLAFVLVVLAVLPPDIPIRDRGLRIVAYHGLPAILGLYLLVQLVRHARKANADDDDAWVRARDLAPRDVLFARAMSFVVPVATLVAGIVLLWPHIQEPEDRTRVVMFFVPLFGLLWTATAIAWFDECRQRLSSAASDSDRRFRAYWAGLASH
jgi:hypothetical protein